LKFRYHFIEKRAHNPTLMKNRNEKAMDLMLSAICLIMCKKVPSELNINKVDQLHLRVKMLPRPAEIEEKQIAGVIRLTPFIRPGSTRS